MLGALRTFFVLLILAFFAALCEVRKEEKQTLLSFFSFALAHMVRVRNGEMDSIMGGEGGPTR